VVGKKAWKVVQFSNMFHLFQHGRPMLEYESLRLLFEFLAMPKNNKKHWSDSFSWTMAEFMHQVVMKAIRAKVQAAHHVVLNCDKVPIIHNQSWLSIHYYVV
jgi:hypothetical protein